jgi:hypothetical protein
MTGRRVIRFVAKSMTLCGLVACWVVALAPPAAADNCDLQLNPADCQNTAWTIGTVAAVAAAATAAAVAIGSAGGGAAAGAEAEGEGEAAGGEPAAPPGPATEILDGPRALEVLQQMGLVRAERQPDGSVKYFPTGGFEDLNSGGRTSFLEVGSETDPATGRMTGVQEATITRVGGVCWNTGPDGSIEGPVIIVERTPPGGWQTVNEIAPGIRAQGDPEFVQTATDACNTIMSTPAGQQIVDEIGATGQQVRIRQEHDPTAGNSYGASRPFDRFQNDDGTQGIGTGGNVYFDPNRVQSGDGTQPWHTRPPAVGLGHELAHARDAARGNQAVGTTTDPGMPPGDPDPAAWEVNQRELQATSIGPYAGDPADENALRQQLGQPPRGSYVL